MGVKDIFHIFYDHKVKLIQWFTEQLTTYLRSVDPDFQFQSSMIRVLL